ncbi:cellulose binding domain-containing protein, partial [Streptosporangium sp. NPDC048865]|uniref:cellulose binding domain-containing protein n=1 Tax=Streptosporangium sp. NPDC048865 TaxID=3155766 RepID=UPI003429DFCE
MTANPRRHAWRNRVATMAAMLMAAAGLATGQAATAHAAVACDVAYTTNDWQGGFTASVTIKNLGDPLTSWTLGFAFTAGQTLQQGWSATWAQSGTQVTARNLAWNGNLATGASTSIGFNGASTGSNPKPSAFTVNGVTCGGQPVNQPPTVSLTSPASGSTYQAGAAVPLAATASDDGSVSKVEFYVDGALVNTDTSAPYSYSATGLSSGSHTASAKAYDNASPALSTQTAAIPFTVGGGNTTPSIVASATSLSVPEGASRTVGFRLSQAPSSSVTVNLTKTGDSDVTITPSTLTFTTANWNTAQNVTVSAAQDSDEANGTATVAAAASGHTGASVAVTEADDDGDVPPITHVDNPYDGAD